MATSKPRVTVTLKPSTYAVLREMSRLTKNSQSQIVAELLEQAEPIFERMVQVIQAAKNAQADVKAKVLEGLEGAQGVLEQSLGLMSEDFHSRSRDLVDQLETVSRRARSSGGGDPASGAVPPLLPPLLTGGSGRTLPSGKKQAKPSRRQAKKGGRRHG